MGPSFLEVATATINGAGELVAEQEAAANEEDKLVAGKGKVSNFTITACFVLIILYSQCS